MYIIYKLINSNKHTWIKGNNSAIIELQIIIMSRHKMNVCIREKGIKCKINTCVSLPILRLKICYMGLSK